MRKAFVALLLIAGAATFLVNNAAATDGYLSDDAVKGERLATKGLKDLSRAARLGTSTGNTDTIYIGYDQSRFNAATNFWSVGAKNGKNGGGAGSEHDALGGVSTDAQWGFEGFRAEWGPQDSLQGWTAIRMPYISTGGQTRADWARPWYAIDVGNNASSAPGGHKGRTFGVVGMWHRDDAGPAVGATIPGGTHAFGTEDEGDMTGADPAWAVIEGSFSAWMGQRAHNDVRFTDPITKNPFTVLGNSFHTAGPSLTGDGTDAGMPGYSSQMDQMLYRDIDMSSNTGANLTISFRYSLEMSTGIGTAPTTRTGWFNLDPLQVTHTSTSSGNLALGNFISSTDAGNAQAPRDSFMVYVGAPTGATFKTSQYLSDPSPANIWNTDPLRKWFSETIQAVDGHYEQLLSVSGLSATNQLVTYTVTNGGGSKLAQILANGNNKVRLVFRVKTNRGFDDDQELSYSSGKKGAVVVDAVTYAFGASTSPAGWGTFEAAGSINNDPNVDALDAWKFTGKPPWATGHVENLNIGLAYDDLCGAVGSATRICDLAGNILTFGDHDKSGHPHGSLVSGTADVEVHQNAISPAILLATPGVGTNVIGLDAAGADATEDLYVDIDLYGGVFAPSVKGDYWRYFFSSYPASDKYGNKMWSNIAPPPYIIFNPDPQCFQDFIDHPVKAWGLMETSNASGIPDSVRITVQLFQRCFLTPAPQCGTTAGAYWDNIDLMLIDGTPQQLSIDIWDLFNDTFPSNETVAFDKASFDTAAAVVKIGRAIGGDFVTGQRYATPGDSILIHSASSETEVHMIFRVLPGAGNYVTNGRPDLNGQFNLRKVPTSATAITSGDLTNFWSSYIANNGAHGSPGGHPGAVVRSGVDGAWDPNVWNSARCDTAEGNVFAYRALNVTGGPPTITDFMSLYHESDPKGGADGLGVGVPGPLARPVNKCYVTDAAGPTSDILCYPVGNPGNPLSAPYPPAYIAPGGAGVPDATTGYPGTTTTYEYTKIIPDGLLTPGAHVQYFIARYEIGQVGGSPTAMVPDTTQVFPQNAESSTDAHRWQQFSVLPDAWKNTLHRHPLRTAGSGTGTGFGAGLTCMLVIDQNDRRGNERVWVSIADSIGATAAQKRGAHNGWSAAGGASLNDPAGFVAKHAGQPGTTWDLYQVKASESLGTGTGFIGGRVGTRDPSNTQVFGLGGASDATSLGKLSRQAPTPGMLNAFYKIIFHMTGDLNTDVLSPVGQRTQDDVAIIQDFLDAGSDVSPDRGYYGVGDGLVEDSILSGGAQENLMLSYFGVDLRDISYALFTGNNEATPDLITAAGVIDAASHTYGVRNVCLWTNDVLIGGGVGTAIASQYENAGGPGAPYISGLRHAWNATEHWISLIDGFDIEHITGKDDYSTGGRLAYYFNVLSFVFGDVCHAEGTPIGALDVHSRDFGNYVRLANNPVRSGEAMINMSLAKADRVEVKIFDVSGRLVRTLADRMFDAGEHTLRWDGSDNDGRTVSRGVYFTQVKYLNSAFSAAKKLTVLQ